MITLKCYSTISFSDFPTNFGFPSIFPVVILSDLPIPAGVLPRKSPRVYCRFLAETRFPRNPTRISWKLPSSFCFRYFSCHFHMNSFLNSYTGYRSNCPRILPEITPGNLLGTCSTICSNNLIWGFTSANTTVILPTISTKVFRCFSRNTTGKYGRLTSKD